MAHAKAEFMGQVLFGGPATEQKPIPYDQNTLKQWIDGKGLV